MIIHCRLSAVIRGRRWTWEQTVAAVLLAVFLTGASCGDSGTDNAATTTTLQPSTTSTTVDVSVIPATIDIAYVQGLFDVFDQVNGGVLRDAVREGNVSQGMITRLATIFFPEELDRQVKGNAEGVRDRSVFREPVGKRRTRVQRLLTASRDCISVEVVFDTTEVVLRPKPQTPTYFGLRPKVPSSDPAGLNPTPYSIFSEDKEAVDPCVEP